MKYNSYDIPAIKFYVTYVKRPYGIGEKVKNMMVSFENIDGLTIKEVAGSFKHVIRLRQDTLDCDYANDEEDANFIQILLGLIEIDDKRFPNKITRCGIIENGILGIFLELKEIIDQDQRIDEYIEDVLLKKYDKNNDQLSRIIKCFLQRYRYNTMDEVDEVLASGKPKKRVRTPGE